ncbi:MAG: hypothetical protein JSR77_06455 [Planctomycetes bacterium]|nr:hypothetical protein [Planctomycetota bacterium]
MRTVLTTVGATLLLVPAARAIDDNTARVTISPNFSGGTGPIDLIMTNSGPVDAMASATGGANSSGSAVAHTDYGFIVVSGQAEGSLNAAASGIFRDHITITSPTIATGTQGTVTYALRVSGTLDATSGFSASSWRLQADIGGGAYDISKFGRYNSPELPPAGYQGDPLGVYLAIGTFQFGLPATIDVEFACSAQASNSFTSSGAAAFGSPFVLNWEGIQSITVNGNPISDFHLYSRSGTDWTQPITPTAPCIADFNQDGGIDGADVEAFFAAWEVGGSNADVNQDGGVDGTDVATFFAAWESGGCG